MSASGRFYIKAKHPIDWMFCSFGQFRTKEVGIQFYSKFWSAGSSDLSKIRNVMTIFLLCQNLFYPSANSDPLERSNRERTENIDLRDYKELVVPGIRLRKGQIRNEVGIQFYSKF